MTQTMPYRVAVDDDEVVIRFDRTLFDNETLAKLLDRLTLEAIRRRSQATQADVDALVEEVSAKAWQRVQTQVLQQD